MPVPLEGASRMVIFVDPEHCGSPPKFQRNEGKGSSLGIDIDEPVCSSSAPMSHGVRLSNDPLGLHCRS